MKPTRLLMDEHRVIEQVLDCLERMAEQCRARGSLDGDSARQALDFFREYADRRHHGKEEDRLFPLMEQHGFSAEEGPVGVMRIEHDQGRKLIHGMDAAIDAAARGEEPAVRAWLDHAHAYLDLLRAHIQKEDHRLFPMADQALGPDAQQRLTQEFDRFEREEIGLDHRDRYLNLANSLAARFGIEPVTTKEL